jgi:magnesium-transporting ATPase (P-type)
VIAAGEETEYGKILKQSSRYVKDEKIQLLKSLVLRRLQKKLLRRNIVLRHERVLDDIRKVDVFLFDKTGVLTSRDIKVEEIYLGGGNSSIDCVRGSET